MSTASSVVYNDWQGQWPSHTAKAESLVFLSPYKTTRCPPVRAPSTF